MNAGSGTGDGPLDALEAIGTARSMRWFKSDPVPDDLVEKVLWAGTRASNPDNVQPWDFVVVRDSEIRRQIGALYPARPAGTPAPPGLSPTKRRTFEGAMNLLSGFGNVPVLIYVCGANIYPSAEEPEEANMYSSMFAAAQNMLVAARALGLGAAFTTMHKMVEPELRDLLGIPADRHIGVTMPLGWPDRPFGPLTRRPLEEVVHYDRW